MWGEKPHDGRAWDASSAAIDKKQYYHYKAHKNGQKWANAPSTTFRDSRRFMLDSNAYTETLSSDRIVGISDKTFEKGGGNLITNTEMFHL